MIRIALSAGEPAGIGPDILLSLANHNQPFELVVFGDPNLLAERAKQCGKTFSVTEFNANHYQPGKLTVSPILLKTSCVAGELNPDNASYVLNCITQAADACLHNQCHALITAPVQKSILHTKNQPFSGHTEFLADYCHAKTVMMLLASKKCNVALQTVHIPLSQVANSIRTQDVITKIQLLNHGLQKLFGIKQPVIRVCGLNPHAGEQGQLGKEEIDFIIPAIQYCQQHAIRVSGPFAADSLFTPDNLNQTDAFLAMYHDQGLTPFKTLSFNTGVNVTLGLPIIRTSVDHGTALNLAGTGQADCQSLQHALDLSLRILHLNRKHNGT